MDAPTPELPAIARATIARHDMLPRGSIVLVMVSGGGDSTALLYLLASGALAAPADLRFHALHINHRLRGDDSDADETFVRDLTASLDVPLRVVRYDVAAYASETGLNLEDAGRRVRYSFAEEELDALADAVGIARDRGRIAVGHTRDDRIETMLMRLAQGAGATGLASLRPVRGRVVRPLADATREQVRAYLRVFGREWREDATNLDTTRLRARVRHELLPLLRDINPRADEALARTLEVLGDEDDLMREMGEAFARDFASAASGPVAATAAGPAAGAAPVGGPVAEVRLARDMMRTLSRPMRRRTLRAALAATFLETSRLEFEHLEALVVGLDDDAFARDLPGGIRAFNEYGSMIVSREPEAVPALAPGLLPIPGKLDLGPAGFILAEEAAPGDVAGSRESVVIDGGRITSELVVDGPRTGDRMRPLGMDGTRKLSDVLVDMKVPRRRRALTPVVRDGDAVVWLAGVRQSEDYKVTDETTRAIRLTWVPAEET